MRFPRPLVLLAGLACLWLFLRGAGHAAELDLLPAPSLWDLVLVEILVALAVLETGRDLPPWRRAWLAGTLLLVVTTLIVFLRTNQETLRRLLEVGVRVDPPYPPALTVIHAGQGLWALACVVIASWLWALRHRIAAVAWASVAVLALVQLLDGWLAFLPRQAVWLDRASLALPAVAFLLLGGVLFRRELGPRTPASEPAGAAQARAGALTACAVGAAVLVANRAELDFPVVPISLAAASGIWFAYATAGWKSGIGRAIARFVAGAILFLLLSEAAHRGALTFARPWYLRMLKAYPDAMTILLFLAASFVAVLLVGGIWRIARPGPDPSRPRRP